MPDEPIQSAPTDSAPAPEATPSDPAATADTGAAAEAVSESIYDTAAAEMLNDGEASAPSTDEVVETTNAAKPDAGDALAVTDGQKHVLSRAGFKDDFVAGWDAKRVDDFVAYLAKSQAEQDRLGAELGRYKQQPETKPEAKPNEAKAPTKTPRTERITQVRQKLIEDAGEEFAPVFDLLQEMDSENAQYREQAGTVNVMADLVTELLVDMSVQKLATEYPSVSKPEARKQLEDRFWLEWNTGAYQKPGVSFREQIGAAINSAAKVTFRNVTEQSAAAQLVQTNKAKLATQPRIGHAGAARPRPTSTEDVYDIAYKETMGASS